MKGDQLGGSGSEVGRQDRPQRHWFRNGLPVRTPAIGEPDLGPRVLPPPPGLLAEVGNADVDRLLHAASHDAWYGYGGDLTAMKRS